MPTPKKRRSEGVTRERAGKTSPDGFIAPTIGRLEHVLYFTAAPSVTEKMEQVLSEGRLGLPGAVVAWDETIGRRTGKNAVPKAWWAGHGSLTVAFAFPARADIAPEDRLARTAASVIRVIDSFQPQTKPSFRPANDIVVGDRKLGALFVKKHPLADLVIVRLNCNTDFSKAPPAITNIACRLIDFIDQRKLPLQQAATLPNTFLQRLMADLPAEFGAV